MDEIEKRAAELAQLTVKARLAKHAGMTKSAAAAPFNPKDVLAYGLGGAGVGAAGAGLLSYMADRKKERILRDILLGGLIGGVGGAAVPLVSAAPGEVGKWLGVGLAPQEKLKGAREQGKDWGESLGAPEPGGKLPQTVELTKGLMSGLYNKRNALTYAFPAAGALIGGAVPSWQLSTTKGTDWSKLTKGQRWGRPINIGSALLGALIGSAAERVGRTAF